MNLPHQNRPILRIPAPLEKEKGLGEIVRNVTGKIGLRHCAGCQRRAALLDRWIGFYPTKEG